MEESQVLILALGIGLYFFGAGAFVGSYIITALSRKRKGMTIAKIRLDWKAWKVEWKEGTPTSQCFSCGHKLHSRDVIPIISYIRFWGKCKYCGNPYGISTLLWELGCAIPFSVIGFILFIMFPLEIPPLTG